MKKVLTAGIGGRSFVIDEDAYDELDRYLARFRSKVQMGLYNNEVMSDIEDRIADLFTEMLTGKGSVVTLEMVRAVTARLGMPDGEADYSGSETGYVNGMEDCNMGTTKKFFRDPDDKKLGGVCSGIAAYFDIDVLLVRILFVIFLFLGSSGFWIYVIFWLVAPLARTAAQKCEMRGWPVTVENMRKFSGKQNGYGNN